MFSADFERARCQTRRHRRCRRRHGAMAQRLRAQRVLGFEHARAAAPNLAIIGESSSPASVRTCPLGRSWPKGGAIAPGRKSKPKRSTRTKSDRQRGSDASNSPCDPCCTSITRDRIACDTREAVMRPREASLVSTNPPLLSLSLSLFSRPFLSLSPHRRGGKSRPTGSRGKR